MMFYICVLCAFSGVVFQLIHIYLFHFVCFCVLFSFCSILHYQFFSILFELLIITIIFVISGRWVVIVKIRTLCITIIIRCLVFTVAIIVAIVIATTVVIAVTSIIAVVTIRGVCTRTTGPLM